MIRNVLFDLGGVLYEIDPARTRAALERLGRGLACGQRDAQAHRSARGERQFWSLASRYERGQIATSDFYHAMRSCLGIESSDEEISHAWNAMLVGPSPAAHALLEALPAGLRISLLSNTNELHHRTFMPACRAILSRFERCYYSYELGLAKPDPLIFERVLGELSFSSRETLVVDDVFENLAAAQMFGTQVLWASSPAWPQQLLARLRSDEH